MCRVQSHVCVVPFTAPRIAPTTESQQDSFDELDDLLTEGIFSSACGWVIQLCKVLQDRSVVRDMTREFRPHYSGRKAINWALLAVCVKEVMPSLCNIASTLVSKFVQLLLQANCPDMVDGVLEYIKRLGSGSASGEAPDQGDADKDVVTTTVNELLSVIADMSIPQVYVLYIHVLTCMILHCVQVYMYLCRNDHNCVLL